MHALPKDYFSRADGERYSREDYYAHPEKYQSEFHTKVSTSCTLIEPLLTGLMLFQIAPYLTLFINGAGWSPSFPRLMTNKQLVTALGRAKEVGRGRFASIGDISCDIGVSDVKFLRTNLI